MSRDESFSERYSRLEEKAKNLIACKLRGFRQLPKKRLEESIQRLLDNYEDALNRGDLDKVQQIRADLKLLIEALNIMS